MGIFLKSIAFLEDEKTCTYTVATATVLLAGLVLFFLFEQEWSIQKYTNLPIAGIEKSGYLGLLGAREKFTSHGHELLKDAYRKYRGKNFVMPTNFQDKIILTVDQIKELANAPNDLISFSHSSKEVMMIEYTGIGKFIGVGYLEDVIRIKLTQNLGSMRGAMVEEAKFAVDTEMPERSTDEWTSVTLYSAIVRIIARMSSRAFIGLPICRNEDWLTVSIMFTVDIFDATRKLKLIPKQIRPIYAYIWDTVKTIRSHKKKAQTLLAPIYEKRLEEERLAKENGEPIEKHNDTMQWLMDRVKPQDKTVDALTEMQLLLSMAAIHTTTAGLVNTILELAARPEYIQPIREEMETVLSRAGGTLAKATLREMRKTDSFIKETMRKRLGLFGFTRKVMRSFTLSDGTYLPKGSDIAAPALMFSRDPDLLENPEEFDGFRWYKKSLENKEGSTDGNYAISTSPTSLAFGLGKHACPGRFFATEEIKLILVFLLLQYDFKYPEGQSQSKDIIEGEFNNPDPKQELFFKKLEGPKKFSFL